MKIRFLYSPECPSEMQTRELLKDICAREGISEMFEEILVSDNETALKEGFLGSPSIQVNGEDIDESRRNDSPSFG